MRKFILLAAMLALCIMLTSCSAVEALKYSISGDIIDPVDDFSRGSDKDTFVFGGTDYILTDEMSGDFEVDITDEDVLLGQTSNFPFFTNTCYYANKAEKPEYITAGGFHGTATVVYLREDLYQTPLHFVLQDTDYEFDFLFTSRGQAYFIIVMYGIEYVINIIANTICDYTEWLKSNHYVSPLYISPEQRKQEFDGYAKFFSK